MIQTSSEQPKNRAVQMTTTTQAGGGHSVAHPRRMRHEPAGAKIMTARATAFAISPTQNQNTLAPFNGFGVRRAAVVDMALPAANVGGQWAPQAIDGTNLFTRNWTSTCHFQFKFSFL